MKEIPFDPEILNLYKKHLVLKEETDRRMELHKYIKSAINKLPRVQKITITLWLSGMTLRDIDRKRKAPLGVSGNNFRKAKANLYSILLDTLPDSFLRRSLID